MAASFRKLKRNGIEVMKMWTGLLHGGVSGTFLNFPECSTDVNEIGKNNAKAAIYGIPFDATTISRSGANWGPRGIRDASRMATSYNAMLDIDLAEVLRPVDVGDCNIALGNTEETLKRATDDIDNILQAGAFPAIIGGDHSITIASSRAIGKHYTKPSLVLFDTHLDTATEVGGQTLNHCCPVPRAMEAGFDPETSVLIGISGWLNPREELEYCVDRNITIIWLEEIWKHGTGWAIDKALRVINSKNTNNATFVSFDIDALDGSYAPATCVPTTAGMSSREAIELLNGIAGGCNTVGFDVAEVAPSLEGNVSPGITSAMACRLVLEALANCGSGSVAV